MFLVLGEVLRAHIFNLVELFIVFFLQAFAMRTYSSSDISNECFYILTFLLYLVLKFQAKCINSMLELASVFNWCLFDESELFFTDDKILINFRYGILINALNLVIQMLFCWFKINIKFFDFFTQILCTCFSVWNLILILRYWSVMGVKLCTEDCSLLLSLFQWTLEFVLEVLYFIIHFFELRIYFFI